MGGTRPPPRARNPGNEIASSEIENYFAKYTRAFFFSLEPLENLQISGAGFISPVIYIMPAGRFIFGSFSARKGD